VPSANDWEHLSVLITFKFSAKIANVPGIQTGVVATWSLGENHLTLWLFVSSGENHLTLWSV